MDQISLNVLLECGCINDVLVKKLIQDKNNSLFHKACTKGNIELVKLFIEHGADVKADDNYVIKMASENGHLEIVKLLLAPEHGADVKASDNYAIKLASGNGHLEVVKLLIDNEADVTDNNNEAIRWASRNGHLEVVKLLIEHGADVKASSNYAIRWAGENGHLEIVKLLIEHGADVTTFNTAKAKDNVKNYLLSLTKTEKQKCSYYGMISKAKLDIKLPELQEIIKNDKYYYVYKCQLQDSCYTINDLDKKILLLNSINQSQTDSSSIVGFFHDI